MTSDSIFKQSKRLVTREFILPFILVTSLFFLRGDAHSLSCIGFIVPLVCFAFIAWYAFFRAKGVKG